MGRLGIFRGKMCVYMGYDVTSKVITRNQSLAPKGGKARKGTLNKNTVVKKLEAVEVANILRERLQTEFIPVLAQMALGMQYIYAIDPVTHIKYRLTDPKMIDKAMQCISIGGVGQMVDEKTGVVTEIFAITAVDPNITAMKEVFDRALGKPNQKIGFDEPSVGILGALSDMAQKAREHRILGIENVWTSINYC